MAAEQAAVVATQADQPAVLRLLQMGRFVLASMAAEDLPGALAKGLTILGGSHAHPWGVLLVDPETRPASLPPDAPNRAQVRALALRHGPWTARAAPVLMGELVRTLPAALEPLLVSVYATEGWAQRFFTAAGFEKQDTVIYFRLNHLRERDPLTGLANESPGCPAELVQATPALIDALAELDAATFEPLWHFGAKDILEMMVRGQVRAALVDGKLAGYAALISSSHNEAHLARLAVHPAFQGRGLGRQLLYETIAVARSQGRSALALNTQASNERSQALYRAAGFVPSGVAMPVYTATLSRSTLSSGALLLLEDPD